MTEREDIRGIFSNRIPELLLLWACLLMTSECTYHELIHAPRVIPDRIPYSPLLVDELLLELPTPGPAARGHVDV
jgi:hypothetical protein